MKRNLILLLSAFLLIGLFAVQTFAKGETMKEKVFYNQTYNNVKIAGECVNQAVEKLNEFYGKNLKGNK